MRRSAGNTPAVAISILAIASIASAQWTTPPANAPGVEYRTFFSPTANATVSFHVSLPLEYHADPQARFPVLYWLHGSGSPIAGIPAMSQWFRNAMANGQIPPMILVFPNGIGASMWCNSLNGSVPMESVVIDDLLPHVDATFRTIASRRGRIIEGFSMGGHGAGRLGLRRPDLFAGISMVGAGPMQLDFMEAPKGTDTSPKQRAALYEMVWGSDPEYYLAQHPWTVAALRAEALIAACTRLRVVCGQLDAMLPPNLEFGEHLESLEIPHDLRVIPGVGHQAIPTLQGLGPAGWQFYLDALATPCPQPADLDCDGVVDGVDLGRLLAAWGEGHGPADLDGNGRIDGADLAQLLAAWGSVR